MLIQILIFLEPFFLQSGDKRRKERESTKANHTQSKEIRVLKEIIALSSKVNNSGQVYKYWFVQKSESYVLFFFSIPEKDIWLNHISSVVSDCLKHNFSCVWLFELMDCSLPGSSDHRILQTRILNYIAISYPRGPSWPWIQVCISFCLLHWQVGSLLLAPVWFITKIIMST